MARSRPKHDHTDNALARWADLFQALPLRAMWLVAGALPAVTASRLGGALLALLGPLSRKQRHVMRNLSFVKPRADITELKRLARGMWRNFGSVLFELPHLETLTDRIDAQVAPETQALLDTGSPVMFLTAHVGNWELLSAYINSLGKPFLGIYTADANPYLESTIQTMRQFPLVKFVDKRDALKAMLQARKTGRHIALLQDVRVDSGVLMPLFGVNTLTTISPSRIACKLNYPIIPLRVERLPGCRFRVHAHAPLVVSQGASAEKATAIALTSAFNELLEQWISERPDQWLVTKRRWPKTSAPVNVHGPLATVRESRA